MTEESAPSPPSAPAAAAEPEKPAAVEAAEPTKAKEEEATATATTPPPSGGGGWFGGGWNDALARLRKRGAELAQVAAADLADFTGQLRDDATKAVSQIDTERVRGAIESFAAKATELANAATPKAVGSSSSSPAPSAESSELERALREPLTGDDAAQFEAWRATSFDLTAQTEEIARLLSSGEALRVLHARLVPTEVPYRTFWERYFWRAQLREEQERRSREILERVGRAADDDEDEELSWDDDSAAAAPTAAATTAESPVPADTKAALSSE